MDQGGGKGVTGADGVFYLDWESWMLVRIVSITEQAAVGSAGNAD
jgi:hypothetical protein